MTDLTGKKYRAINGAIIVVLEQMPALEHDVEPVYLCRDLSGYCKGSQTQLLALERAS